MKQRKELESKQKKLVMVLIMLSLTLFCTSVDSAIAQVEDNLMVIENPAVFIITIENPHNGEVINGNSINLHFSVNKTVDYLWVYSTSYKLYVDGVVQNQSQQTINSHKAQLLDETVNFALTTQGQHIILVNAEIKYCPSSWIPLNQSQNVSSSINFISSPEITPPIPTQKAFTIEQPTLTLTIVALTVAIIALAASIIYKKKKHGKRLQATYT
jgi:hypothetical protein